MGTTELCNHQSEEEAGESSDIHLLDLEPSIGPLTLMLAITI
jgi:hypothetical protein